MSPHSELCVAKPVRTPVSFEGFPIGPKRTCDRAAGKTAVTVRALLAQCCVGGRQQTSAARNELPSVEASASIVHLQTTPFCDQFSRPARQPANSRHRTR